MVDRIHRDAAHVGARGQRTSPGLADRFELCSSLPTSPMVARQSTCTLRSPERSRNWA